MAVVKAKPTSPGRRFVVRVTSAELHKGAPYEPLLEKKSKSGGRNNKGRITTRHRGGGHKQRYRVVDFKRDKDGVPGVIERLEYDPNRTAHIALIKYADGERRYIIAPAGVKAGDAVQSGIESPIAAGNCLPLRSIPVGTQVHCIELKIGKGAQIARSAGASAQLVAREGDYATLRLRSGEMRKVHSDCPGDHGARVPQRARPVDRRRGDSHPHRGRGTGDVTNRRAGGRDGRAPPWDRGAPDP